MIAHSSYLPAPRVPSPDAPTAEAFASAGVPLPPSVEAVHTAHAAANSAVNDLTAGRPGGDAWAAAMDADASSLKAPAAWALERLMGGEAGRFAAAHARARQVSRAKAGVGDDVRKAVRKSALDVMAEAEVLFGAEALAGWKARTDPGEAWARRKAAEVPLAVWRAAYSLAVWSGGDRFEPSTNRVPGGVAGGSWLALCIALDNGPKLLHVPAGLVFPDEEAAAASVLGMRAPGSLLYAGQG